jgi:hypothetical protein
VAAIQAAAAREELGATSSMPTAVLVDCTMVVALGSRRLCDDNGATTAEARRRLIANMRV